MEKHFELIVRHFDMETKFINCSISNAIGILQTDMQMRGIDITITIPIFWDMYFKRNSLNPLLWELLNKREIVIRRS
jgi:hypothetical protein